MNIYEKLGEALNVEFNDDYRLHGTDLEISQWNTADGYELHVMTHDPRELDWEYDVYYYEPSFDVVIDRIKEAQMNMYDDEKAVIFVADLDQYLPEYEVNDYLEQLNDENNA